MRATGLMNDAPGDDQKVIDGILYRKGDKVRLNLGKKRSDAGDMFINNKIATIETIYTDYEDKIYLAVTLNDDPGRDLLRELSHYLYFSPEEVIHEG